MDNFKARLLAWANQFDTAFYLDSNGDTDNPLGTYECLIAVSVLPSASKPMPALLYQSPTDKRNAAPPQPNTDIWAQLHRFWEEQGGWLFGYLGYDLKNDTEQLCSLHQCGINLPDLYFVQPDIVLTCPRHATTLEDINVWYARRYQAQAPPPADLLAYIKQYNPIQTPSSPATWAINLAPRLAPDEYIAKVTALQTLIQEGDLYEVNFCQEFYAQQQPFAIGADDICALFAQLNQRAQAPMSAYIRLPNHRYVLCASPERYLQKKDNCVWSQPIKGTIRRSTNPAEDQNLQQQLYNDPKERAENVMIVDLVRNDLTQSAVYGSVKVSELFGVYAFRTVHHLVSTITAQLRPDATFAHLLRHSFPMGSMTGAPKIRAMQRIEQYETRRRGLFSGSIGYITPRGDMDFNVVIRSLLHRADTGYWSLQTGGAITAAADPKAEYDESLLKAAAIRQILV